MNREQKAAFIEDVAERVQASDAIFAVDYRGITVSQVAELRAQLREADASFQIVKNTLTRRALDQVGSENLKEFLEGPTAFTYVRGDIAAAAKAITGFTKEYEILEFKGGQMEGQVISADQFKALSKLPTRDVLIGQLVGMVAMPLTQLTRGLGSMIGGLALQLGQIAEQGLVGGDAPAPEAPAEAKAPAEAAPAEEPAEAEESPAEEPTAEEPAAEAEEVPAEEAEAPAEEPAAEAEEASAEEEAPAAEEAPAEENGE